jgi:hypothetical protein
VRRIDLRELENAADVRVALLEAQRRVQAAVLAEQATAPPPRRAI